MTSDTSRPVLSLPDWAPAQEALYEDATRPTADSTWNDSRDRSMSISLPWRRRKSSLFGFEDQRWPTKTSHGQSRGENDGNQTDDGPSMPESTQRNFKGIVRRASVSVRAGVKGIVSRRSSISATTEPAADNDFETAQTRQRFGSLAPPSQRPTTSSSTWHRLRQAASFHRSSRMLHTGYGDRTFDLEPIESPTFPIPGSGEQPPIIPRNTGAAARQAAAWSHNDMSHNDIYSEDNASIVPLEPKPIYNWSQPQVHRATPDEGLRDYESGVGIAVMSSEMDAYVPSDEVVDSDIDVDMGGAEDASDISKIDFISQLPTELAIQVLAYLDAATLAKVARVSTRWNMIVANQHIWRESFLREKTTTYATGGRVQPGTGMGVPSLGPNNDWREIYRAKSQLDKRWQEGKAQPVYLNGHQDSIYCLQFDETKIITGSRDKTVRVWDMKTFACKMVIGPPDKVNDPEGSLLYDENTGKPVHFAMLPDEDLYAPFNTQPLARSHESMPALVTFPMHHNASILCLQYDDDILVTGSSDSTCIVHSVKSGYRPIRQLRHHSAAVLDLVFDNKHIVTCSKDISICVWDRETGSLLKQLRGHSGPVNAVQMRGNTIVSCSGDFRVKLWNIDTGKNIREFSGHTKGLACSQFSEDGRYVASAGNDKVIRIWDANTGECVREMRAHNNLVRSLHVDSVSGRLVSGSYDTDIKVFDMDSGRQLLDFPSWHNSWVLSAKSDYRRIVSTGQDPKILIMDFGAGIKGIEMLESTTGRVKVDVGEEGA